MALRLRSTMAMFTSVITLLAGSVSCVEAQVRGYTLSQLIDELRTGVLSESTMTRVQALCLAFVITPEAERQLAEAGATAELIAALRDTCNSTESPWSGSKVQRFSAAGQLGALPGRAWGYWFVAPVDCLSVGSRYSCHFYLINGDGLPHHVCVRAATMGAGAGPSAISRPARLALTEPSRHATTAFDSLPATSEACRTLPPHTPLSLIVRADMGRRPSVGQLATVDLTLAEADKTVKGHGAAQFAFRKLAVPAP